ncbi:hypothetical protein, partial [Corynebacterium freiburgense]|uniref:hypothetical protein n=1 Tax=Corynebacterium freiburgense TaxID=556548 RepID=UPI00054FD31F
KNKKTVENQVPTIHHDQPHASSRSMNPASNTQPTTTNSQNKPINHNKQTWHTIEFSNNTFHFKSGPATLLNSLEDCQVDVLGLSAD